MDAILVDQVTALYIVLAVALVVFGGIFAYLWKLNNQAGLKAGLYPLGAAVLAAIILGFGGAGLARMIAEVNTALWLVMIALLVAWVGIFYYLWQLDNNTKKA